MSKPAFRSLVFAVLAFVFLPLSAHAKTATLVSIQVSPATASIPTGLTQQFSATGTFSDGSTKNITSSVTWSSSNPSVASINSSGLATGIEAGFSATVTATSSTISGKATLQVTSAVLTGISVSPSSFSLSPGQTQQLQATGTYSDGSTSVMTNAVAWSSSATSVGTVSATGLVQAIASGTATITATSGSVHGSASLTVSTAKLVSISVSPVNPTASAGKTVQFKATGTYSDNSTQDITTSVSWKSSNTAIATINSSGLATAIAPGSAMITASVKGGISSKTTLTVKAISLVSIAITPANSTIPLGTTEQLTATGTYSDGSTQNLTSTVVWSSSNTAAATVSSGGLATSHGVGSTTITATSGSVSGQTGLTVSPAALVSISVTPTSSSIALGTTQQFSATGTYTDGSTQNLTGSVIWASSAQTVATIASTGLATSKGTGSTSISALLGSVTSNSASLTVLPAVLQSIAVTPSNSSIALGTTQQFTATGTYSDGSTQDLTSTVTWSSDTLAIAKTSSSGLATTVGIGSANISATSGAVSGSTTLTVTAAQLVSIAITPAIPTIPLGTTQQFTATGTYTDNSTQDLTATVHWSSSNGTVATISNSVGSYGLATSETTGATTITAVSGSVSGSTTLTVSQAELVSIAVTPANPSIALGTTQQFTATGTYTDSSTKDLTVSAVWSSSATSVATVDANGLAHSMSTGSAVISATVGPVNGTTTLSVTQAVLSFITVLPFSPSIPAGTTEQFTATGNYTDGSTQDLTSSVHWSTSDGSIATISNAAGTFGLATGISVGSVTVTAISGNYSGNESLSVTPAVLVSIAITPQNPSIALGQSQQFVATGTYTDQSTKDITTNVTWTSSSAMVAVISNNTGSQGLAVSAGVGSATITAAMGSISSTTTLTVGAPQLVSIAVTPANTSIASGTGQQFKATGTYTDNSTADITSSVTWSSSNTAVATISTLGHASGLAQGSTTITATSGSISGSTTLTVVTPVLTGLQISPINPSIAMGLSQQFKATAVYSDSSTQDVSSSANWTSSNTAVATISSTGLASSIAQGSTTIRATYSGQSASTSLTVGAPGLISIAVTPNSASVTVGSYVRFTATGTYTNQTTANISNLVTWSSSNSSVSTVDATGLAHTAGAGAVTITATSGTVQGTASLTVVGGTGVGSPRFAYTANQGSSSISGYLIDQATGALTAVPGSPTGTSCCYPVTVTSDPTGRFVYAGNEYGGVSGFTSDPVTGQLTSIPLSQQGGWNYTYSVAVDPTGRFLYAANQYTNNGNNYVGNVSAYMIDAFTGGLTPITGSPFLTGGINPQGVVIDPTGKFLYVGNAGSNTISAFSIDQQTGALTAMSGSPFAASAGVQALAMAPGGQFLYAGSSSSVQAYAINSTTGALTAISGSPFNTGSNGIEFNGMTIEPTGHYLFTANYNNGNNNGNVSVFSIDAVSGALTAVTGSPFATGGYPLAVSSDASGKFLYVTDLSTSPGAVRAFTINSSTGALTAVSGSPFTAGTNPFGITTTGAVAASTATLQSVAISPATATISNNTAAGHTAQFILMGTFSDGTVKSITESATWSSSNTGIATVSNNSGSKGLAISAAYGTTTITASYNNQTATATLTVQAPTLVSIAVTPTTYTIASGTAVQFHATGTYSDNSTLDLTTTAAWTSSNTAVATVSNNSGTQGQATGVSPGTITITATSGTVQGTASLTVQ